MLEEVDASNELPPEYADPEIMTPKLGQYFVTERDAFNLYNLHAIQKDFGIRYSKNRHNAANKLNMREFCCSHHVIVSFTPA